MKRHDFTCPSMAERDGIALDLTDDAGVALVFQAMNRRKTSGEIFSCHMVPDLDGGHADIIGMAMARQQLKAMPAR